MRVPVPDPSPTGQPPRLTYDPHWLAITRALHPYLSLDVRQTPLPRPDQIDQLVQTELERIQREGLLVPGKSNGHGQPQLVWEKGPIDVARVQKFWPTAPAQGQPGGSPSQYFRFLLQMISTERFSGMVYESADRGFLWYAWDRESNQSSTTMMQHLLFRAGRNLRDEYAGMLVQDMPSR